ncbi:hypothetical protein ACTXT7_016542, partial [Hymenolepis weldensis]
DAGATNDPPKDLVMKNQSFRMGVNMNFSLISADKEKVTYQRINDDVVACTPIKSESTNPKPIAINSALTSLREQANCQITRETVATAARFPRSHSTLQSDESQPSVFAEVHIVYCFTAKGKLF